MLMERNRKNPNQITLFKKILFSFVPLLVIIFLLEIIFRIFPPYNDSGRTISGFVIPDKDLIWRLEPRKQGSLATNELGLRDTKFKKNADIKILLLGDSISWGNGIGNLRYAFPYLLEGHLSAKNNKTYEVINASVPGYSTFQQLRYLELYGIGFKPNMIILQFCLNDVVERYSVLSEYGGDNIFLGIDTRQSISGLYGVMVRNSRTFEALMKWLVNLSRNRQEYDVKKMATDFLSEELEEAWSKTFDEIEGIRRIAALNNIPILLLITPYRFQLGEPNKMNQPQIKLLKYANSHNLKALDLLPYFSYFYEKNKNLLLYNDALHFSINGHALTATILIEPVLAMLGVASSTKK